MAARIRVIGGVLVILGMPLSGTAQGPLGALSGHTSTNTPASQIVSSTLTPAQRAPIPPHVTYVDGQLTIIAENCRLGDILRAVNKLTAVQIDLPAGASEERMAARLGPGPTRDVLVSLLSSTDFNFILQADDDDSSEVQSVFLTPRGKKSSNSDLASARMGRPGNRRMIEPTPAPEETSETQIPEPSQPADTANASQGIISPAPSAAQSSFSLASSSDSNQPQPAPVDMQGLQHLYEQRRQMIQQQNQTQGQKPATTNP